MTRMMTRIFVALILLASAVDANAGRMTADMVGCDRTVNLWKVTVDHSTSTTNEYINSGNCMILRQGQKVTVLQRTIFEGLSMSQVNANGEIVWVLSDFVK